MNEQKLSEKLIKDFLDFQESEVIVSYTYFKNLNYEIVKQNLLKKGYKLEPLKTRHDIYDFMPPSQRNNYIMFKAWFL